MTYGIVSVERLAEGVAVAPPGKLQVMLGDSVRVTLKVEYRGPAIDGQLHVSFGRKGAGFNEDGNKQITVPISFSYQRSYKWFYPTTDIYIAGNAGINYDLYAKIMSVPGSDQFTPEYLNVLDVLGESEFRNFMITDYSKV